MDVPILRDIKRWRGFLANGLYAGNDGLSLAKIKQGSQDLLTRLLFIRTLESRGDMPARGLAKLFERWSSAPNGRPFGDLLRREIQNVQEGIFKPSPLDEHWISKQYLDPIILPGHGPESCDAGHLYGFDFAALDHDILGASYEQFLAHEIKAVNEGVEFVRDAQKNKRNGVYYTPRYIVGYIIAESIAPRVERILEEALGLLKEKDEPGAHEKAAHEKAAEIFALKILDPSCGSGAFLVEVFDFFLRSARRYNDRAKLVSEAAVLRQVEERICLKVLHGVDLDAQALSVARLSLWTRLLRARTSVFDGQVLTKNIRHGNSLVPGKSTRSESERHELSAVFADADQLKKIVESAVGDTELSVDQLRHILASREYPRQWSPRQIQQIEAGLGRSEEIVLQVDEQHPFYWESEFADVFSQPKENACGFDIIIGNPPYFKVDAHFGKNAPELRWLKWAFPEIHTDKTDIQFYFMGQAVRLLADGGEFAYIVSRSFMKADKAKNLRRFLAHNTRIDSILDFLGNRVFDVEISTAVIHGSTALVGGDSSFEMASVLGFDDVVEQLTQKASLKSLPGKSLSRVQIMHGDLGAEPWGFGPYQEIFDRIDAVGPRLKERDDIVIGQGMQTGRNSAFVLSAREVEENRIPDTYLKVRARGIEPYGFALNDTFVLYLEDRRLADLPATVQQWLASHEGGLTKRAAFRRGSCKWFQFSWPLHRHTHFEPKVLSPYRAPSNCFAVDPDGERIGLTNTTVICPLSDELNPYALAALLNSSVLNFRYRALGGIGKLTGKGMFEYFESQIGKLPIPPIAPNKDKFARLAELGERAHQLFAASDDGDSAVRTVDRVKEEIDDIAHQLYGTGSYRQVMEKALETIL